MSNSVPIPLDVLAETQAALDCALALVEESAEAYGKVMKARVKLTDCLSNKAINGGGNCSTITADKKQSGYLLLRRLDEVRREIKKDYGIEK